MSSTDSEDTEHSSAIQKSDLVDGEATPDKDLILLDLMQQVKVLKEESEAAKKRDRQREAAHCALSQDEMLVLLTRKQLCTLTTKNIHLQWNRLVFHRRQ